MLVDFRFISNVASRYACLTLLVFGSFVTYPAAATESEAKIFRDLFHERRCGGAFVKAWQQARKGDAIALNRISGAFYFGPITFSDQRSSKVLHALVQSYYAWQRGGLTNSNEKNLLLDVGSFYAARKPSPHSIFPQQLEPADKANLTASCTEGLDARCAGAIQKMGLIPPFEEYVALIDGTIRRKQVMCLKRPL